MSWCKHAQALGWALEAFALAAIVFALSACVAVNDGRRERDAPTDAAAKGGDTAATGGADGAASTGGAQGGTGGSVAGADAPPPRLPAPNVDAIFETGCATASAEAELPQVNLLFVLDRSASMRCNPPPMTPSDACEMNPLRADPVAPSKWEVTRNALSRAIRALPPQTTVGISYFSNDDACGVHSRPRIPLGALAPAQIAAIDASLANITPAGATPLVGATIVAYRHLHESALAGTLRGERFVVLLTDGEQHEECFDPERCTDARTCTDVLLDEEVAKAAGAGVNIRTFVIGAPGSERARSVLSRIAALGGTAPADCDVETGDCHFDMSEEIDLGRGLSTALEQIVGRALSCKLPLPGGVDDVGRDRVNVVYSPSQTSAPHVVPRDDSKPCDSGADGWQYAPDQASIQLCGQACNDARKDSAARVDVVLGCPVQGPM